MLETLQVNITKNKYKISSCKSNEDNNALLQEGLLRYILVQLSIQFIIYFFLRHTYITLRKTNELRIIIPPIPGSPQNIELVYANPGNSKVTNKFVDLMIYHRNSYSCVITQLPPSS